MNVTVIAVLYGIAAQQRHGVDINYPSANGETVKLAEAGMRNNAVTRKRRPWRK